MQGAPMNIEQLFDKLWQQYSTDTPMVKQIHDMFQDNEGKILNDHVAFRTFDDPRVDIEVLAEPFLAQGYVEGGQYDFPVKKLFAKHYEHPNPELPKVFISQLLTKEFSDFVQDTAKQVVDRIPQKILDNPEVLLTSGVCWQPIEYQTYEKLLTESEYAAWLYAFGFRANHFTVNVNALKQTPTIQDVNNFLKKHHIELNASGGEVKGTPNDLLEQSSTLAFKVPVKFQDGTHKIPSSYYEFALRYPKPDGKLYSGFVAASADKIFESTDNK